MRTALYERHLALGAKMTSFGDWEMPLWYQGISAEHHAVRTAVGLFDVSHMGRIDVVGPDAERFLDYLSTNSIAGRAAQSAIYTAWCHEDGGTVDDLVIFKEDHEHFFVIVNAANRQKDLDHLQKYAPGYSVKVRSRFDDHSILALQGPYALPLMKLLLPELPAMAPMHFTHIQGCTIARTGYTGEPGFEIFGSDADIVFWWEKLLEAGASFDLQPAGLGARDTLRLEMGYALYGHELSDAISPTESVSAWTVKGDKVDFLGKATLNSLEGKSSKRKMYGIALLDRGIAREGYQLFRKGRNIGVVTSGTFSPTRKEAIALILVSDDLDIDDIVDVKIREQFCKARVVKIPFIERLKKSG